MGVMSFIGSIFKPAADLVDELHTSDEEKGEIQVRLGQLKLLLEKARDETAIRFLEHETTVATLQSKVVTTEAQSESWLTRTWRPIVALMLMLVIMLTGFGLMDFSGDKVPKEAWTLLTVCIGGYMTVGRSGEKMFKSWAQSKNGGK